MNGASVKPNKWAQFDPQELLDMMQRRYPGFPLEQILALPLPTIYELLEAKAKNHND